MSTSKGIMVLSYDSAASALTLTPVATETPISVLPRSRKVQWIDVPRHDSQFVVWLEVDVDGSHYLMAAPLNLTTLGQYVQ